MSFAYRYVRYKQTSLEKNYRYEVLTEHDLGVTIDLINPEAYTPQSNAQLHPTDERLLEDDILTPQVRLGGMGIVILEFLIR